MTRKENKGYKGARSEKKFYGWHVVVLSSITGALTAPGQSIGISVFREPMAEELMLSDTAISTAYLVGTIIASLFLPRIGRWVDKTGVKITGLLIVAGFSAALAHMSLVNNIFWLSLGFIGIRALGQGALSLVSRVSIVHWFEAKRGFAIGVSMTLSTAGMSLLPLLLSLSISRWGWRNSWIFASLGVLMIATPIIWFGFVNKPEDLGQEVDGGKKNSLKEIRESPIAVEKKEVIRSRSFWLIGAVSAVNSLLITGLVFHQTNILGEVGYSEAKSAAMFLPQALGAVFGGFLFGWLADRKYRSYLPAIIMLLLFLASGTVGYFSNNIFILSYAFTLGLCLGGGTAVNSSLIPFLFGVSHVGSIFGILTFIMVLSSSVGAVFLALGEELFGSYREAILLASLMPLALSIIAMLIKPIKIKEETIGNLS